MVGLLAATAHADQVRLVGGSSIEGKATRRGDKIVIEVESGEISLSVDDVERIDPSVSIVQRFESMRAKVGDRDVRGLMTLANFCRDNDMKDRERQLLQRVIEVAPEQGEARARLGYVRSDAGWIKREEQLAQQQMGNQERFVPRSLAGEVKRQPATRPAPAARDEAPAQAGDDDMTAQHSTHGGLDPLRNVR